MTALSMDSLLNERKLLLDCVKQLLALETSLRRPGRELTAQTRRNLVLVHHVVTGMVEGIPLHPALEGLTVTDLIGYRMEEALSLIRKASSGDGGSGQDTAPEGRASPLETT